MLLRVHSTGQPSYQPYLSASLPSSVHSSPWKKLPRVRYVTWVSYKICFYVVFLATVRSVHPPTWVTCGNFHALFLTTLRGPRKVVNTVSYQRGELARMTLTPMLPGSANQYVNPGSCGVLTKGLCFNTSLHRTFLWFFRRSIPLSSLCIYFRRTSTDI